MDCTNKYKVGGDVTLFLRLNELACWDFYTFISMWKELMSPLSILTYPLAQHWCSWLSVCFILFNCFIIYMLLTYLVIDSLYAILWKLFSFSRFILLFKLLNFLSSLGTNKYTKNLTKLMKNSSQKSWISFFFLPHQIKMLLCFQFLYTLKNILCETLRIKVIKENIWLNQKLLRPLSNFRLHTGSWSWYWRRVWRLEYSHLGSVFSGKNVMCKTCLLSCLSVITKRSSVKKCIWLSWSSFSHSSSLQLCIGSWKSVGDTPMFWLLLSSTGTSSALSFQQCISRQGFGKILEGDTTKRADQIG